MRLLNPVENVPVEPDRTALAQLVELHATVAESEGVEPAELHLAKLLARRGPAALSSDDDAWCSAIGAVVRNCNGMDWRVREGNGRTAVPVLLGERGWRPELRSAAPHLRHAGSTSLERPDSSGVGYRSASLSGTIGR